VGNVCDAVASAVSGAASAAGGYVMRGVTEWVTDAAVWVTGKVGDVVNATTSPDLTASWFQGEYGAMLAVAGALALLMLMLAVIQALMRQDVWMLGGAASGDHVYSSANAGVTWTDHGAAPLGVTDLAPTGSGAGFATGTTAKGAILWAVRGDGTSFSHVALPGWVTTVGNQMVSQN